MTKQTKLSLQPPHSAVEHTWTPDDIYDAVSNDVTIVERFLEDRRVERKPARIHANQLSEYFTIFSNKPPSGGVIFIGVRDGGEIEGISCLGPEQVNDIERAGAIHCPDARIESKFVQAYNDKGKPDAFIAIRVQYRPDKLVQTSRGECFTRDGSSRRKLSDIEKREIRIKKGEVDYEREDINCRWPNDFDMALVDEYVQNYRAAKRLTYKQKLEDVLVDTRLGRISNKGAFYPNVACALLFAKDPRVLFPGAYVRLLKFAGKQERSGSKYNLIDGKDIWIDGPLPRLLTDVEETLGKEIRKFTRLGSDGKFHTRSCGRI